jgi:hypothetical protein
MLLAVIVAAVAVPVGLALSESGRPLAARVVVGRAPVAGAASVAVKTTVLIPADEQVGAPYLDEVSDAAKLFLVGTMLVSVAVAVRRSV